MERRVLHPLFYIHPFPSLLRKMREIRGEFNDEILYSTVLYYTPSVLQYLVSIDSGQNTYSILYSTYVYSYVVAG